MKRVVIVGRGGSGKSTLADKLGEITGLSVIELDKIFWQPGLRALPPEEWAKVQSSLIAQDSWIMDGDLGQYDAVEVRLRAADTIILLDFALVRCAWWALRRGIPSHGSPLETVWSVKHGSAAPQEGGTVPHGLGRSSVGNVRTQSETGQRVLR